MTAETAVGPAVGRNLQQLRAARGWTQEEAALAIRRAGLRWTRAQVVLLESGRRADLTLGESYLISCAFGVALKRLLAGLPDLEAWAEGQVPSAPDGSALVTGADGRDVVIGPRRTPASAAEQRAATRLSATAGRPVTPEQVRRLSMELWEGRTLDAERDRRLGDTGIGASRSAYRSQITRGLLAQMEEAIREGRTPWDRVESFLDSTGTGQRVRASLDRITPAPDEQP